jgi:L-asparaginase
MLSIVTLGGTVNSLANEENKLHVNESLQEVERTQVAAVLMDAVAPEQPFMSYAPLWKMSEDFTSQDWFDLAGWLGEHIKTASPNGVIILHGTDTMEWTASALSFLLAPPFAQNFLTVPIVLTGASRPAGEPDSDAGNNLAGAISAAHALSPGVYVSFSGEMVGSSHVHIGTRVTKQLLTPPVFLSTDVTPVAVVDMFGGFTPAVEWESLLGATYPVSHPFDVLTTVGDNLFGSDLLRDHTHNMVANDYRVGVELVEITPSTNWGLLLQQVDRYQSNGIGGVVLQTYLSGTAPTGHGKAVDFVKACVEAGIPVVGVPKNPQTSFTRAYDSSHKLLAAGMRFYQTMTTVSAVTKLTASIHLANNILGSNHPKLVSLTHSIFSIPVAHEMMVF